MFRSVGMPDNFSMIISPVKKFLYINGFGGMGDRFDPIFPPSKIVNISAGFGGTWNDIGALIGS